MNSKVITQTNLSSWQVPRDQALRWLYELHGRPCGQWSVKQSERRRQTWYRWCGEVRQPLLLRFFKNNLYTMVGFESGRTWISHHQKERKQSSNSFLIPPSSFFDFGAQRTYLIVVLSESQHRFQGLSATNMLTRASSKKKKIETLSLSSSVKDDFDASILDFQTSSPPVSSASSGQIKKSGTIGDRLRLEIKKRGGVAHNKLPILEDFFENDFFRVSILEDSYFGLIGTWTLKLVSNKWRAWMTCYIKTFGRVLQFGGQPSCIQVRHLHDPTLPTICCFDLETMKWELESSMPLSRAGSSACFLPTESALIVAGGSSRGLHHTVR